MKVNITIIWIMIYCSPVGGYWRFGRTCCVLLQGWNLSATSRLLHGVISHKGKPYHLDGIIYWRSGNSGGASGLYSGGSRFISGLKLKVKKRRLSHTRNGALDVMGQEFALLTVILFSRYSWFPLVPVHRYLCFDSYLGRNWILSLKFQVVGKLVHNTYRRSIDITLLNNLTCINNFCKNIGVWENV